MLIKEKVEQHSTLNPKLFDLQSELLHPKVLAQIKKIVIEFLKNLSENNIKIFIKDILLIGSNCAYNYTDSSDIDIHIIADTSKLKCPDNLYSLLYSAYRTIFKSKYNIKLYDIPVEMYVETEDSTRVSNGEYSILNNKWNKKPTKETAIITDKLIKAVTLKTGELILDTTKVLEENNLDKITKQIELIYDLRKNSIGTDGEYSLDNLVFKELRNAGLLDKLKDKKNELKADNLSLK